MNIHEYQAKEILKKFGVAIQDGRVATTPEEAVTAAQTMKELYNSDWVVLKSQIHAGGRGKGKIVGTEQRGVALAKNHDQVREIAKNILR
jgi:succinyl-CoA synthetase beta subunit